MKKNILILVLVMLFGMGNIFAQEQKAAKDTKVSEVILSTEMHCQNCADKVAKQLAYTKGVIDVQANHEKDAVYIKYRNDRTDTEKLIASLKEIGYTATVFNAGHQCPHAKAGACNGNHSGCNHAQQEQQKSGCSGNHAGCSHSHDAQKTSGCSGNHTECQHKHDATK